MPRHHPECHCLSVTRSCTTNILTMKRKTSFSLINDDRSPLKHQQEKIRNFPSMFTKRSKDADDCSISVNQSRACGGDVIWIGVMFLLREYSFSHRIRIRKKKNGRLTTSKERERESLTQRVSVFFVDVLPLRNSRSPGQVNAVCLLRLGLAMQTARYSSAHQREKEIVYDDVQMPTRTFEFDRWFALHNWDTSADFAPIQ